MIELAMPTFLLFAGVAALGVLATLRGPRTLAIGLWTLLALAWLLAAPVPVNAIVRAIESSAPNQCHVLPNGSTLVILMGGVGGQARSDAEAWHLKDASLVRTLAGLEIARSIGANRILISGGARSGYSNEARLASHLAVRLGWPRERLDLDEVSLDTWTSAHAVAMRVANHTTRPPLALVTSALHMPRAALAYRRAGLEVLSCPVDFAYVPPDLPGGLVPQITALRKASEAWHELGGLALYSLRSRRS